jgi:hypothetical protein
MADPSATETVTLLKEIRDLLLPVADAYRDEYERRKAEREEKRLASIRALLSTEKRAKAWALADGTRTQRQIAKEAGLDEGGASKFFKALRDLEALTDSPNPTRATEVLA